MEIATTPRPRPHLITVSYFKSQRRVNNTDVTRYNLLSLRLLNDRKLSQWLQSNVHTYAHFSVFRTFTVCCDQFFMFCSFFNGIKYGGLQKKFTCLWV